MSAWWGGDFKHSAPRKTKPKTATSNRTKPGTWREVSLSQNLSPFFFECTSKQKNGPHFSCFGISKVWNPTFPGIIGAKLWSCWEVSNKLHGHVTGNFSGERAPTTWCIVWVTVSCVGWPRVSWDDEIFHPLSPSQSPTNQPGFFQEGSYTPKN